ncbi:MAG: hypothetical protein QXR26_04630 [Candidatus Caldarchaeum sp.]
MTSATGYNIKFTKSLGLGEDAGGVFFRDSGGPVIQRLWHSCCKPFILNQNWAGTAFAA